MARPKTKKAEPKKAEAKKETKPVAAKAARRLPISFHFPKFGISAQVAYLFFGITIPALMIWLANWMIFSLYAQVATIKDFLSVQADAIASVLPDFVNSPVYEEILFKLDSNQGIVFVVVGILVFAAAITLAMWMARRFKASTIKLGDLSVQSLWTWFVLSFTTLTVVLAVLQQLFINSFPTELKQIFWP
ncbi:hypothetical protein KC640_02415 [Candidatus Dojkabacteria bacterium]|uniref:Uncharacterized protein n=1 Tax=Candidatus Dojkabacteria bacterium TaxID=2099670 RepID=A0A955I7D2_9BACT|nr:hypothetical protein [Candidatus Dojkabacteria bacterium]